MLQRPIRKKVSEGGTEREVLISQDTISTAAVAAIELMEYDVVQTSVSMGSISTLTTLVLIATAANPKPFCLGLQMLQILLKQAAKRCFSISKLGFRSHKGQ